MESWNARGLALKKEIIATAKMDPDVLYAQRCLNRWGFKDSTGNSLKEDGLKGPKTTSAIKGYQEAIRAPVITGILDTRTWGFMDWESYSGWSQGLTRTSSLGPGGPAIVSIEGRAYNELTLLPVNLRGMTREAQRGVDVITYFNPARTSLGRAVKRDARGTTRASYHWLGEADDDMTDDDKDGILEDSEIIMSSAIADYMFLRNAGGGLGFLHRKYWSGKFDETGNKIYTEKDDYYRGPDRLRTMVWHNHDINGRYHFSNTVGKDIDWSWSAKRNTWIPNYGRTLHRNHNHNDFVPGAPAERMAA